MLVSSALTIGATGTGKSEFAKTKARALAESGQFFQFTADGKGTTAEEIFAHEIAAGRESRVIYHVLASPFVIGLDLLRWSDATGYNKEIEDDLIKQNFKDIFIAAQGERTDRDAPWKKDWLDAALDLHRYQSEPKPVYFLYYAFLFESDEFRRLIRDCTHEPTRVKFSEMEMRRRQNKTQAEAELGGARRRIAPLMNPLIQAHVMARIKLDLEAAIVARKHLLINGNGVGRETFRVFVLMLVLLIVSTVKSYFLRTGQRAPCYIRLEEAGADQLVAPFIIEYMQTLRFLRVFFEPMSQSFADFGDDVQRLNQNAPEKRFFGLGSLEDIEMASRFLALASFNSREVHYETERQLVDGVDERRTRQFGKSGGKSMRWHQGKLQTTEQAGENVSEGTSFVARHRTVVDPHFKDLPTKQGELARDLFTYTDGRHALIRPGSVQLGVYEPMLHDPWDRCEAGRFDVRKLHGSIADDFPLADLFPNPHVTLYEFRLRTAIHRQRRQPFFSRVLWNVTSSPDESEPAPIPNPATRKGGKGMRRS